MLPESGVPANQPRVGGEIVLANVTAGSQLTDKRVKLYAPQTILL